MTENTIEIIQSQAVVDHQLISHLRFHTNNELAKAHFPGKPIVPGALVVQVMTDCLAHYTQQNVTVTHLQRLKFIELITDQAIQQEFQLIFSPWQEQWEGQKMKIELQANHKVYVKLEAQFSPIS